MNLKEIKELIEILKDTDVTEFELEKAGTRVKVKKGTVVRSTPADSYRPVAPVYALAPEAPAPAAAPVDDGKNVVVITSPIVGTFYRSPSPETAVYVEIGDVVKKGQILCIIEAMKLMNEIEAEVGGKVVSIDVDNAQPIEYGEPLFHIEPI